MSESSPVKKKKVGRPKGRALYPDSKKREVFERYHREPLSLAKIAEQEGIAKSTVESWAKTAYIKQFRKELEERDRKQEKQKQRMLEAHAAKRTKALLSVVDRTASNMKKVSKGLTDPRSMRDLMASAEVAQKISMRETGEEVAAQIAVAQVKRGDGVQVQVNNVLQTTPFNPNRVDAQLIEDGEPEALEEGEKLDRNGRPVIDVELSEPTEADDWTPPALNE